MSDKNSKNEQSIQVYLDKIDSTLQELEDLAARGDSADFVQHFEAGMKMIKDCEQEIEKLKLEVERIKESYAPGEVADD